MFLPPAAKINLWKEVLHNKRGLKTHDRVCERHFLETDIIQYWEANINGQIHLTPRDKPKLRENAVPSLNLPSLEQFQPNTEIKKRHQRIEVLSNRIITPIKRKENKTVEEEECKFKKQKQEGDNQQKAPLTDIIGESEHKTEASSFDLLNVKPGNSTEEEKQNHAARLALFESLYDEAFDVTLPSLLWGIHRDPERKFLAFSEYNSQSKSTSKLLHVSNDFHCETFVSGKRKLFQNLKLEQLTTDHLSALLDDLDSEDISS